MPACREKKVFTQARKKDRWSLRDIYVDEMVSLRSRREQGYICGGKEKPQAGVVQAERQALDSKLGQSSASSANDPDNLGYTRRWNRRVKYEME